MPHSLRLCLEVLSGMNHGSSDVCHRSCTYIIYSELQTVQRPIAVEYAVSMILYTITNP